MNYYIKVGIYVDDYYMNAYVEVIWWLYDVAIKWWIFMRL